MTMALSSTKRAIGKLLEEFGYERVPRAYTRFLDFKTTLREASAAGLSVEDYVELRHATGPKSPLDETMDHLLGLGVFAGEIETVCEIGPGSGRYLRKTLDLCHPRSYEIYETANDWRDWLVERYGVTARTADGRSLSETASEAIGLVQSHKTFPGVPVLTTIANLLEMARVVRSGGWVVFDVMTEECFDSENLNSWYEAKPWTWGWSPQMIARNYVIGMFAERGLTLEGSFKIPLFPGVTECMAFRKTKAQL